MTHTERLAIKVGDMVRVRDDAGIEADYKVKYEPWELPNGTWLIGLAGISGGYRLDRVTERLPIQMKLNWQPGPARGSDPLDARCPMCGYTEEDSQTHMDHSLCLGKIPAAQIECGDRLLVLVETVCDRYGNERHKWDSQIIVPTEDGFDDSNGESWSAWSWSDVSYWVKLDKSNLPPLE
jgi:hypothetical protein